jgi:hypothetical protein
MPRITVYNNAGLKVNVKVGSFDSRDILDGNNATWPNAARDSDVVATVPGFGNMFRAGGRSGPFRNNTALEITIDERAGGAAPVVHVNLSALPAL